MSEVLNTQTEHVPAEATEHMLGENVVAGELVAAGSLSPESQVILDGGVEAAKIITNKYPQQDENGKLNYYFAGSMAAMLLAQATSFDTLDKNCLPEIEISNTVPMPPETTQSLQRIIRLVGDIDIALTPEYEQAASDVLSSADPGGEDYQAILGSSIAFGVEVEFTETARNAIRRDRGDISSGSDAARVTVGEQVFYITDPKAMFAYKAEHLVSDFASYTDKAKVVNDFSVLLKSLVPLYGYEALVSAARDMLIDMPNAVLPTYDNHLDEYCREFFGDMVSGDEDATYLATLDIHPVRALGILNVLRNYQTNEAKLAVGGFINEHTQELDRWKISPNTENSKVLAEYIGQHLEQYEQMLQEDDADRDDIEYWLRTNKWAFTRYGDTMPADIDLSRQPHESRYLALLAGMDEANITQELSVLSDLMTMPHQPPATPPEEQIDTLFSPDTLRQPKPRQVFVGGLDMALKTFDQEKLKRFVDALDFASYNASMTEERSHRDAEWFRQVGACFTDFGLPFDVHSPTT
jgi:hypothetical protein